MQKFANLSAAKTFTYLLAAIVAIGAMLLIFNMLPPSRMLYDCQKIPDIPFSDLLPNDHTPGNDQQSCPSGYYAQPKPGVADLSKIVVLIVILITVTSAVLLLIRHSRLRATASATVRVTPSKTIKWVKVLLLTFIAIIGVVAAYLSLNLCTSFWCGQTQEGEMCTSDCQAAGVTWRTLLCLAISIVAIMGLVSVLRKSRNKVQSGTQQKL